LTKREEEAEEGDAEGSDKLENEWKKHCVVELMARWRLHSIAAAATLG
jgi:hypothetical protein